MTQVAYALRADYEHTFQGGVLNIGNSDFDVAHALKEGGGTILIDDETDRQAALKCAVLDEFDPLKRVPVKAAVAAHEYVAPDSLDGLTKDELLKLPEADRVDGAKGLKVDDLRAQILEVRKDGETA